MALMLPFKYMLKDAEEPDPGDLIEFLRGLYCHWAVYVGCGYVVHLAGDPDSDIKGASANSLMCVPTQKAMVKREKLQDVAGNNKWIINNSLDEVRSPRSPVDIVREATALVGQEQSYHFMKQNCEHFATKMRYGKALCLQVFGGFGEAALGYGILFNKLLNPKKKNTNGLKTLDTCSREEYDSFEDMEIDRQIWF